MQKTCIYCRRVHIASQFHQIDSMTKTSPKFVFFSLAVALITCFSASALIAGDAYVATLTGVECSGCKKTIAKSLAKIDGVQTIRIEKSGDKTHKMTVTTDGSAPISKAKASAALKHAEHYKIVSWKKSS